MKKSQAERYRDLGKSRGSCPLEILKEHKDGNREGCWARRVVEENSFPDLEKSCQ